MILGGVSAPSRDIHMRGIPKQKSAFQTCREIKNY